MHRIASLALLFGMAAGCGSTEPKHSHPEPLAAKEHERQAAAHEHAANVAASKVEPGPIDPATDVRCIDHGVPMSSGGEEIKVMKPCWTNPDNEQNLREAEYHRKAAADHKIWARKLRETEQEACRNLGRDARSHSPFYHNEDMLSVVQYNEDGDLRGARVTFRKVPGLTEAWMMDAIRCHQARAAVVGYAEDFMPYCPLVVEGASASVKETDAGLVVTIRSKSPTGAAAIYGRAQRALNYDHHKGDAPTE